jgi:cation/acetate symporter
VIVLGIFSKKVGAVPAMAGMVCGIGFTAFYIIACVYGGMKPWFGISPQGIGVIGMLINFGVVFATYRFSKPPSARVREMIDQIRRPEDLEEHEAATLDLGE